MTGTLNLDGFRAQVRNLVADQKLSSAEASSLIEAGPLTEEQKVILRQELRQDDFADAASANATLAALGLSFQDLAAPPDASGLGNKVKKELTDLAKKELYKPYDLKAIDMKGDHAGIQVRVKAQLISKNDPLIAEDAHRAKTTLAAEESGKPVTWATVGGGVYPRVGFGTSIPVGPATISAGFSVDSSVGYSLLAPYPHDKASALAAARNLTVDLPLSSKEALKLASGSEAVFRGRGQVAANASIGLGKTLSLAGEFITVGASFGASFGHSKEMDLAVRVKRLDGAKFFISISKVDGSSSSASVGAHVGIDAHLAKHLPDLGGGLYEKAGQVVAEQVEKQVEKWLRADIRAVHSKSDTEKEITNYVVDLTTPEGQKIYDDLLRLDTRAADALAETPGNFVVRRAQLSEQVRSKENALSAHFGNLTLLNSVSRATETHGTLVTSQGEVDYHRAKLEDGYSGFLSNLWRGKRSISRELISTVRGEHSPEYHYHVQHRIEGDGVTSGDDVRRFLTLASALGAEPGSSSGLTSSKTFLKSFGPSDRNIDVFFTQAGLAKLVSVDPSELTRIHAAWYEKLDQPTDGAKEASTTPWLMTNHPKYAEVIGYLEKGPEAPSAGGRGNQSTRDTRYRSITGRSLSMDSAAYRESKNLVAVVMKMKNTPDPKDRIHLLAEQDKKLGLEFMRELATFAEIAGPDAVLVNDMSLLETKSKRELVLLREGAIQDPSAEIQARLAAVA